MFSTRTDFRNWLTENCTTSQGVWLIFSKQPGIKTLKASEALEEALCFGWIDGQMQSIDDSKYIKYFSSRRNGSKWSERNKKLVMELETKGLMTDYGRIKIEDAKKSGMWDAPKPEPISEEINHLLELFKDIEPDLIKIMSMTPCFDVTSEDEKKT